MTGLEFFLRLDFAGLVQWEIHRVAKRDTIWPLCFRRIQIATLMRLVLR
jgi:hypothetical protein